MCSSLGLKERRLVLIKSCSRKHKFSSQRAKRVMSSELLCIVVVCSSLVGCTEFFQREGELSFWT